MLSNLTQRLSKVIKTLRGQARLTPENMQEMLREVRMALLEADVALPVVKAFITTIKQQAEGQAVIGSLSPGQALVGIVHQELAKLLGGGEVNLNLATRPPAVILMAGLQGTGKTTTAAKLARYLKESSKKKVLLVSCDVYRPAAIEQLHTLATSIEVDFFHTPPQQAPLDIATSAQEYAKTHYHEVLIVDTAGRLTIDAAMMQEIAALHQSLNPVETLFVVDAMQGQDALNTAKAFNETLPLTGIVLTKLDGDARGGAALSAHSITGQPIKFVGTSEKVEGLEPFHPERMASRILGMGDIVSLVETVQRNVDEQALQDFGLKIKSGKKFDLNDFKNQLTQMKKMGGVDSLIDKLPVPFSQALQATPLQANDKMLRRTEGIINSMTPQERQRPEIIKATRKRRIAAGAGVSVQEVNRLLNQFEQTQKMMKQLSKGGKGGIAKMMRALRAGMH